MTDGKEMHWGLERPLPTKWAWMAYKVTAKIIMIVFEIIKKFSPFLKITYKRMMRILSTILHKKHSLTIGEFLICA